MYWSIPFSIVGIFLPSLAPPLIAPKPHGCALHEKVVTIPPEKIYPGRIMSTPGKFGSYDLHGSLSDVFLVRAENRGSAAKGAGKVFFYGEPTDKLVHLNNDKKPREIWLATHLGSNPRRFHVAVQCKERVIKFSYKKAQSGGFTAKYFWANLGELKSGTYFLELHDMDGAMVVLRRRVIVH